VEPLSVEEVLALDPGDINSFDRASITPFRETLDGDVMMYASFLLPLSLLSHEGCREDIRTLGVMWAEVLLLEAGLNAAVKSTVLRTRPYAYDDATPMDKSTSRDARLSFFSGHTGITAATSFYIASVFSAYPVSSATKTLIWAGAVLYPAVTAYLRRDSGNHFRTDVITGYAVGGLIGWLVPFLHRTGRDAGVAIGPSVSPAGSGLRFAWTLQ
jgi:membrane-associated phospholipid phosphatase